MAVVLAAGSGRRFGGTKQLAVVAGRPLVAHAVGCAHAAGLRAVVVVGHDADAVGRAARAAGATDVVVNPAHATGQASSLQAGIAYADRLGADAVMVLLADQPAVRPAVVRAVADAAAAGAVAARARYDDGPGHPVMLTRAVWPRLAEVSGDRGARDLLAELEVVEVPVPGPAPPDVDTPDDLPPD